MLESGERNVAGLWSLFGTLLDLFQRECANDFSSYGDDPE